VSGLDQQFAILRILCYTNKIYILYFNIYFRYDFKGIIDYVFYSAQLMRVLGVLGPLDPEWLQTNKIVGCPHPNVPSDHFSLLVEFELNPATNDNSKNSTISIPVRRQ
jgi:mRNA deadenylase 3'-5' endonuclease subunit Ccr4